VIRVYDEAGNVIETHEHKGDFKEPWAPAPDRIFSPWDRSQPQLRFVES